MKLIPFRWAIFMAFGVFFAACNQPGIIGSDLLEQDRIEFSFTDTFPFLTYLKTTDSLRTYGPLEGQQLLGFLCGQFDDPVFGRATAVVNAQVRLNPAASSPFFKDAALDSVVLVLPYRSNRVYGDTTETYDLEVWLLDENMDRTADYFSNRTFEASRRIGAASIVPTPNDSLEIRIHGDPGMATVRVTPQARIRLDDDFALEMINEDSLTYLTDSTFLEKYKGLQVRGASPNKGILSFNLLSGSAGIIVYYRVEDTISRQYIFPFTSQSARMVSFSNDFAGAPVEAFLQDSTRCDSLVFVQGMAGLAAVIEIPNTALLQNKIVNRAELEFTLFVMPEDGGFEFPPVAQFIASIIKDDGSLEIIPEISLGLARQDLPFLFGGVPVEGDMMIRTYRMNISSYIKNLKNGTVGNRLLITPLFRSEQAARVALCGPKHSVYPAKIKLSLTDY
jgi:hypothetical protein